MAIKEPSPILTNQHGRRAPQYLEAGTLVDGKFQILKMIGGGGFGQIYRVSDVRTDQLLAIKVEPEGHEPGRIILEQKVLLLLKGSVHAPDFVASGNFNGFNFIVMQWLGRSLSELRKRQPERRLSLLTVVRSGKQCVEALKELHDVGYVHRDVKPSNFCIGLGSFKRVIYMIDFGMARKVRNEDGTFRKERWYAGFRGTMRYVSVTVHERREQGPVDDLWSLFYTLTELLEGRLPWSDMSDYEDVAAAKKNASFQDMGRYWPPTMNEFIDHLNKLEWNQFPSYSLLIEILQRCLLCDVAEEMPYDWEVNVNRSRHSRRKNRSAKVGRKYH